MECETVQRELLHLDWDDAQRQRMIELLGHLEGCESCRSALEDFDRLRGELAADDTEVEPSGGWSAFEDRLTRPMTSRRWRWRWTPPALAASLLLAVAGWSLYLGGRGDHGPGIAGRAPAGDPPQRLRSLGFTPREVADRVEVFDEVSRDFDRRAQWVVIGDKTTDLGLGEQDQPVGQGLLLLRLTLSGDDDVASRVDLVIVPGQRAELTVPTDEGPHVRYRVNTSDGEPIRLQLWVDLIRPDGERSTMAALATDLTLEPGQVTSAGRMVTSSGRYELNVGIYRTNVGSGGA